MSRLQKLRQIKDAMSPEAIRQGLESGRAAISGGGQPTEEQLAALTPEQRAAYDANMARVAEAQAQVAAARQNHGGRVLGGPAGEHVHGRTPDQIASEAGSVGEAVTQGLKEVLRAPFGRKAPKTTPANPDIAPGDRDGHAAAERAARDAARAPYLAPEPAPVAFTRLATRGRTHLDEVAAYLGSAGFSGRPDLVYGIYRVADHIGGGGMVLRGDGSRVIEWDIVHAATTPLPAATPATAAHFDAREQWVARRAGEPSILDEDLAVAYLQRAGIGPEHCLGIARNLHIRGHGGDEESSSVTLSQVVGVHAFHPVGVGDGVFEQLRAERPLALTAVPGVHAEVLNWRGIAQAVHPARHRRPPVPSPFPYLPLTAQELLRAYLEIVGVQPSDCYCAQVTEDRPADLTGHEMKGPMSVSTNRGEEQPCADGELRRRLAGGSRIVVVYRDRDTYTAGRERFDAYQRDVLQAALQNATHVREPVQTLDLFSRMPKTAQRLWKTAEFVAELVDGDGDDGLPDIPAHRYCWPPAK